MVLENHLATGNRLHRRKGIRSAAIVLGRNQIDEPGPELTDIIKRKPARQLNFLF